MGTPIQGRDANGNIRDIQVDELGNLAANLEIGGQLASPTNRVPVGVLLRPFNDANVILVVNDTAQATAALPAGTIAVRIQKAVGVGVRWRIVSDNSTPITNTQGQVLLPDVVGPIDVPATAGQFLQVVRMQGDTGTGLFAVTPLGV